MLKFELSPYHAYDCIPTNDIINKLGKALGMFVKIQKAF